jgi:ribosomal protein S18 acetylase RimI-like enzyme
VLSLLIRPFIEKDRAGVIALWRECGLVVPWNDPSRDIDRKLLVDPDLFLVGVPDDDPSGAGIAAAVMGGYEGHRGWINYLAVSPGHRGLGYGRMIMEAVEKRIAGKGCPKINLQVRTSNLAVIRFYEHLGYSSDNVIGLGKRLVDDGEE